MNMFWKHHQYMNLDIVRTCRFSDATCHKIFNLKALHHLISILSAPLHVPKIQANLMAVMFQCRINFHPVRLREHSSRYFGFYSVTASAVFTAAQAAKKYF